MSSSRATNSAKMKRASDFGKQVPPRPSFQNSAPQQPVKILISDAIGLLSLRLGKVEQMLQINSSMETNIQEVFEDSFSKIDETKREIADLKETIINLEMSLLQVSQKLTSLGVSHEETALSIIPNV